MPVEGLAPAFPLEGMPVEGRAPALPVEGMPVEGRAPALPAPPWPEPHPRASRVLAEAPPLLARRFWSGCHFCAGCCVGLFACPGRLASAGSWLGLLPWPGWLGLFPWPGVWLGRLPLPDMFPELLMLALRELLMLTLLKLLTFTLPW